MEGIQLSVEKVGYRNSISIIKVGGYIDTTTSSELEHALNTLLKAGSYNIIIDLGNVDYVSSAGWGIFISEIKGIREKGGDLKLVRMIPEVYEVFELLEFHFILKAFETIDEAVKDFEKTLAAKGYEITAPVTDGEFQSTPVVPAPQTVNKKAAAAKTTETLQDKVQKIIRDDPEAGTIQILKTLNSSTYGYEKPGWFALRKLLKQLDLDSKRKRLRFSTKG
ncbi:STAS domain-containing protein [bacterium]|nr:STAS domain-containing protein [bacterium]